MHSAIFIRRFLAAVVVVASCDAVFAQTVHPPIAAGSDPSAIAINPVTNKVYVANDLSNDVTVLDGATGTTTTIAVGTGPQHIAVNPTTNKIYVSNVRASSVSVIDGATGTVDATLATGGSGVITVNPVTNRIYVARYGLGDEI